jgi:hypothetical protein
VTRESRCAIVAGLAIAAGYAALAAWSSSLSPLARGPLLDGTAPMNYRWVSPPPELASTNQPPSSGRFELPLREAGVGTQVQFTDDGQVTVVIDEGAVGPEPGERAVELAVEPVDPARLGPPGEGLAAFGNAYRFTARYRPSGDRVGAFDPPIQTIVVYPATSSLHANAHDLLYSRDGETWSPLDTTDSPGQQQAAARIPGPGYLLVAGVPTTASPDVGGTETGGGSAMPPVAVALLVAAGVALVVGLGLLIRGRAR